MATVVEEPISGTKTTVPDPDPSHDAATCALCGYESAAVKEANPYVADLFERTCYRCTEICLGCGKEPPLFGSVFCSLDCHVLSMNEDPAIFDETALVSVKAGDGKAVIFRFDEAAYASIDARAADARLGAGAVSVAYFLPEELVPEDAVDGVHLATVNQMYAHSTLLIAATDGAPPLPEDEPDPAEEEEDDGDENDAQEPPATEPKAVWQPPVSLTETCSRVTFEVPGQGPQDRYFLDPEQAALYGAKLRELTSPSLELSIEDGVRAASLPKGTVFLDERR